jgi:hypothetical protein
MPLLESTMDVTDKTDTTDATDATDPKNIDTNTISDRAKLQYPIKSLLEPFDDYDYEFSDSEDNQFNKIDFINVITDPADTCPTNTIFAFVSALLAVYIIKLLVVISENIHDTLEF